MVEENSWFHSDTVRGLCEHMILTCIRTYVKVANEPQFEVRRPVRVTENDTVMTLGILGQTEGLALMDLLDGTANEADEYDASTQSSPDTLRRKILEMLVVFMGPMVREYDVCVIRYGDFASKMRVTREKEKDGIVAYMGSLKDEMRTMDNRMKELRLGRWNAGMQKGLTRYVGATYDAETRGGLGASGVTGLGDLLDGADAADDFDSNEAMDMSGLADDDGGEYE